MTRNWRRCSGILFVPPSSPTYTARTISSLSIYKQSINVPVRATGQRKQPSSPVRRAGGGRGSEPEDPAFSEGAAPPGCPPPTDDGRGKRVQRAGTPLGGDGCYTCPGSDWTGLDRPVPLLVDAMRDTWANWHLLMQET